MDSTRERRAKISGEWHFDCCCSRCEDPTELGTYISAVRCRSCKIGYLLPKEPLEEDTVWHCNKCGMITNACTVLGLVDKIKSSVNKMQSKDIDKMENFLSS